MLPFLRLIFIFSWKGLLKFPKKLKLEDCRSVVALPPTSNVKELNARVDWSFTSLLTDYAYAVTRCIKLKIK